MFKAYPYILSERVFLEVHKVKCNFIGFQVPFRRLLLARFPHLGLISIAFKVETQLVAS